MTNYLYKWIPYKIVRQEDENLLSWLYIGDERFTEPFFDETIIRCLKFLPNSQRYKVLSDFDFLKEAAENIETVEPAAFIFHISRCGSTTVSQLLSTVDRHIVLSEVPFFDDLLRGPYKHENPVTVSDDILKAAIALYCKKRNGNEEKAFIKNDSWHCFFYKTIRRLYPSVPFILLYRNPVEVMHSLQKKPGMQSVPGIIEPKIFGFTNDDIITNDIPGYAAKVMEKFLEKYIEISEKDDNSFLVNFSDGMISIIEKICRITSTNFNTEEMKVIKERSNYHGKYPDQKFNEAQIDQAAPPSLEKACTYYNQLEEIRLATNRTAI